MPTLFAQTAWHYVKHGMGWNRTQRNVLIFRLVRRCIFVQVRLRFKISYEYFHLMQGHEPFKVFCVRYQFSQAQKQQTQRARIIKLYLPYTRRNGLCDIYVTNSCAGCAVDV